MLILPQPRHRSALKHGLLGYDAREDARRAVEELRPITALDEVNAITCSGDLPGHQKSILNLLLVLILSPYLKNNQLTGHNAIAMKASNELPQPSPRLLYISGPARGRNAPRSDRNTVFAAIAEAA